MKNEIHCILKNPVCVSAVECPNCGWNAEVHARRVTLLSTGAINFIFVIIKSVYFEIIFPLFSKSATSPAATRQPS